MADENQARPSSRAARPGARTRYAQVLPLTLAAGGTVAGTIAVPPGAWITTIRFETETAFTGTPTNINARVGRSAAAQDVVADVGRESAGRDRGDESSPPIRASTTMTGTLYIQATSVGGASPAGTVNCLVEYFPPVH